jgi:putative ABC transport system ATP-binding protein
MDQTVRLSSVGRTFGAGPTAVVALDDVTMTFPAGSFTAVMGPSGAGKSTLLQCAAGLDRPTTGTVVVGGVELQRLGETALTRLRRDRIGFIFQAFNLLPSLTAEENVGLPLRLAGRRAGREEIKAALSEVGLADWAGHRPSELSGGQQQRVAIARALVTRPAVVFADEPTGALDTAASRRILGMLRDLADHQGQTIVMVTHDPVAASYADKVVFLEDGRFADELDAPTPDMVAVRMTRLETAC